MAVDAHELAMGLNVLVVGIETARAGITGGWYCG